MVQISHFTFNFRLLREDPDHKPLKLSIIPPGIADESVPNNYIFLTVLDCDTIIQVKEKCADAVYRNRKFSEWPPLASLSLKFCINKCEIPLVENQTVEDATGRERLMTVKDYNIKENNVLKLVIVSHDIQQTNNHELSNK